MILVFFFLYESSSDMLTFSENDFDFHLGKAKKMPFFSLFFADGCPQCEGIVDGFEKISDMFYGNDEIDFMLINCTSRDAWCREKGALSIPQWSIINSADFRSWHTTNNGSEENIIDLLDAFIDKSVVKIESHSNSMYLGRVYNGYSYFHFTLKGTDVIKQDERLSSIGRSFKYNTFTYSVEKSIEDDTITVYRSSCCNYTLPLRDINLSDIIKQNKYSHYRRYSPKDFEKVNKSTPLILLLTQDNVSRIHEEFMLNASRDYCTNSNIGFFVGPNHSLHTDNESVHLGLYHHNCNKSVHTLDSDLLKESFDKLMSESDDCKDINKNGHIHQINNVPSSVAYDSHDLAASIEENAGSTYSGVEGTINIIKDDNDAVEDNEQDIENDSDSIQEVGDDIEGTPDSMQEIGDDIEGTPDSIQGAEEDFEDNEMDAKSSERSGKNTYSYSNSATEGHLSNKDDDEAIINKDNEINASRMSSTAVNLIIASTVFVMAGLVSLVFFQQKTRHSNNKFE